MFNSTCRKSGHSSAFLNVNLTFKVFRVYEKQTRIILVQDINQIIQNQTEASVL